MFSHALSYKAPVDPRIQRAPAEGADFSPDAGLEVSKLQASEAKLKCVNGAVVPMLAVGVNDAIEIDGNSFFGLSHRPSLSRLRLESSPRVKKVSSCATSPLRGTLGYSRTVSRSRKYRQFWRHKLNNPAFYTGNRTQAINAYWNKNASGK